MYWPNAHVGSYHKHACKRHAFCGGRATGWTAGENGAEGTVKEIDYSVSYLEDAPTEELERQSDMIRRIAERLKELGEGLRQE